MPEVDIGQIKLGQVVDIKADAYPDQVFKGEVRLIAPEAIIEQNVTSFQVRIQGCYRQTRTSLWHEHRLTFLGQSLPQALMVPTVAIVTNKGQTGVLVPGTNNKPRFKSVTIGSTIGNQTQILDGIKAGDPVFVELPEGQKLEDITKGIDEKK